MLWYIERRLKWLRCWYKYFIKKYRTIYCFENPISFILRLKSGINPTVKIGCDICMYNSLDEVNCILKNKAIKNNIPCWRLE